MKKSRLILFIILALLTSFLTFYTTQLFMGIVVNYEIVTKTSLAPLTMVMFNATIITLLFYMYRYNVKGNTSEYSKRFYGLLTIIFSVLGVGFAIYTGLGIYQTFIGENVFAGYPLILLIVNTLMLVIGLTLFVNADMNIRKLGLKKPVYEHKAYHRVSTLGFGFWVFYSLNRFGALILTPLLISRTHWYLCLPYYTLMVIPAAMLVFFLIYRDFAKPEWKAKFGIVSNCIFLGVALLSGITCLVCVNLVNVEYIQSISNVLLLERLVKFPVDTIINVVVAIILPLITVVVLVDRQIRAKKAKTK